MTQNFSNAKNANIPGEIIAKATFPIRVKTGAKKTEILSIDEGVVRLAVKAPPEEGKANKEIIRFLKKMLKKDVRIIAGFKSKDKVVRIENL